MTSDIPTDAVFVPTDRHGRQFHEGEETVWSLPSPSEDTDRTAVPGAVKRPPASGRVVLLDLDGLLEELGERIFVAKGVGESTLLVSETAWSLSAAAHFALDCAEHVSSNAGSVALASGETLLDAIAAARSWLEDASGAETGLLGRISQLATLRRLRRQAGKVGDVAFDVAIDAEAADADMFDDPRWTAIAATRDAVLAAIEAVRHDAFPHITEAGSDASEGERRDGVQSPPTVLETPWGSFRSTHTNAIVPGWVAATEAAERARQAATDTGEAGAAAERAWQRDRLSQALRGQ